MCFVESPQGDSTLNNTNEEIVHEPHLEIQLEVLQQTILQTIETINWLLI